jgi:serine/threonine protein phosphatase 1
MRLFRLKPKAPRPASWRPAPGQLPEGLRVYAIGDIHGCDSMLERLHDLIALDWAAAPAARAVVVHLGDFVDRGAQGAAVLERVAGPPPIGGAESVSLRGNHEVMMLDALAPDATPDAHSLWLANGGTATLESFPDGVPGHVLDWLRALPLRWQAGNYLFVHAGIDPRKALDAQTEADLLWIREPFLSWSGPLGVVVVHGHTPVPKPQLWDNRIGIDTGAVGGGPLTCLVLQADKLRFLAVPAAPARPRHDAVLRSGPGLR